MQQLTAWSVTAFLTVSLIITGISASVKSFERKDMKQNMNLAGLCAGEFTEWDGTGNTVLDEENYLKKLKNELNESYFAGLVVIYPEHISGLSVNGNRYEESIDEEEKKETYLNVSRMISKILADFSGEKKTVLLETSSGNLEENHKTSEEWFNDINISENEIYVFLVGFREGYSTVSGFSLQSE